MQARAGEGSSASGGGAVDAGRSRPGACRGGCRLRRGARGIASATARARRPGALLFGRRAGGAGGRRYGDVADVFLGAGRRTSPLATDLFLRHAPVVPRCGRP